MEHIKLQEAYETGFPNQVLPNLIRRISAFTRAGLTAGFKIGITSDPEGRARKYIGTYERMVLIYRTESRNHVVQLEKMLVAYNFQLSENRTGGGGGKPGIGPFFLYVVTTRRKKRW